MFSLGVPANTEDAYGSTTIGNLTMKAMRIFVNTSARIHAPMVQLFDGATCEAVQIGPQLTGISLAATEVQEGRIILHFHGGAHVVGNVWCTRELVGRLSAAAEARIISVEYRLAPEHPFPAGLDDALTAWRWVSQEYPGAPVALAGDSAGGNLAFALLVKLAQLQEPQPVACITMSPWLLLDHEKCVQRASSRRSQLRSTSGSGVQAMIARAIAEKFEREWQSGAAFCVGRYCHGGSPSNPLVSPVLAGEELVGRFPPVLIHASHDEPLAKDAQDMAELCARGGATAELVLFPGSVHVFQAVPFMRQKANTSLQQMSVFLEKYW